VARTETTDLLGTLDRSRNLIKEFRVIEGDFNTPVDREIFRGIKAGKEIVDNEDHSSNVRRRSGKAVFRQLGIRMEKRWFKISEAADHFAISRKTLYSLIARDRLPDGTILRIGRQIRINVEVMENAARKLEEK